MVGKISRRRPPFRATLSAAGDPPLPAIGDDVATLDGMMLGHVVEVTDTHFRLEMGEKEGDLPLTVVYMRSRAGVVTLVCSHSGVGSYLRIS